jgi:hypothetical protein
MWDLWWRNWQWDRFLSEFFNLSLSIPFHYGSPYSYIIWAWTIGPLVAAVRRHILTPSTWTTVAQLITKFPVLYRTQRFITVYTRPPSHPMLNQVNPVEILNPYFLNIHFNITLSSIPMSLKWSSGFLNKVLYAFRIYHMHATRPIYDILR